jgi:hypothetical protein
LGPARGRRAGDGSSIGVASLMDSVDRLLPILLAVVVVKADDCDEAMDVLDETAVGARFGFSSDVEEEACGSSPLRPLLPLPLLPLCDSPDGDSSDEERDGLLRSGGEGGAEGSAGEKGATRTDRIVVIPPAPAPPDPEAGASSSAVPPGSPACAQAGGRFCEDMLAWWGERKPNSAWRARACDLKPCSTGRRENVEVHACGRTD